MGLYDGASHFKEATTLHNFDGDAKTIRKVTTDWDVTGQSLTIGATTGYINPGAPSTYLPCLNELWLLNTPLCQGSCRTK